MATVAFVGLGAMGLPMADNLLKRQHQVRGFDFKADALAAHVRNGGVAATSAADNPAGPEPTTSRSQCAQLFS